MISMPVTKPNHSKTAAVDLIKELCTGKIGVLRAKISTKDFAKISTALHTNFPIKIEKSQNSITNHQNRSQAPSVESFNENNNNEEVVLKPKKERLLGGESNPELVSLLYLGI